MRGTCPVRYDLHGCPFACSKATGHGGRHLAMVRNSPLGRIVAVWAA